MITESTSDDDVYDSRPRLNPRSWASASFKAKVRISVTALHFLTTSLHNEWAGIKLSAVAES